MLALRCVEVPIDTAEKRILGPGLEMPLRQRLLLLDGVCGRSRVIHHARFRGAKKCHHESLCNYGSFAFVRVVGPSCSLWNQAGGICKAVLETRI